MTPEPMVLAPLSDQPLVSVLVANHNYARFLAEAVASVRYQSYTNWEVIICDDGSTDDSRSVLESLLTRGEPIRVVYKERGGQASAWNQAFEIAKGDIICFLDADDIMLPSKLETVVDAFQSNSMAGYAYHRYRMADQRGVPLGTVQPGAMRAGWLYQSALHRGGYAFHTNALVSALRREVAERMFPLPEGLGQYGDRYMANIASFLTEIVAIPDCLAHYRVHGLNHSGDTELRSASLRVVVDAMHRIFPYQHEFLASTFGCDVAEQVRLADVRSYWEHIAAIYILDGKQSGAIEGYPVPEIRSHLQGSLRSLAWLLLFALPASASRWVLSLWWRNAWWKPLVRPFGSALR